METTLSPDKGKRKGIYRSSTFAHCPTCKGYRKVKGKKCKECNGVGLMMHTVRIEDGLSTVEWRKMKAVKKAKGKTNA